MLKYKIYFIDYKWEIKIENTRERIDKFFLILFPYKEENVRVVTSSSAM